MLDDDVPFVKDKQRYGKDKRQLSVERCIQELEKRKKPYVLIKGDWKERFEKAADEIKKLVE